MSNSLKFTKLATISTKVLYVFLSLMAIYILLMTVYFLSAVLINTELYDHIVDKNLRAEKIAEWMNAKQVAYISNAFIVIAFIVSLLLKRKEGYGFWFWVIWAVMLLALIFTPIYAVGSFDEIVRQTTSILGMIIMSSCTLLAIRCLVINKVRVRRKNTEIYRTMKGTRKNG